MKTKILCILDRSGSMQSFEKDVIGGFNGFLSEQQKLKDKATLTLVLFDNEYLEVSADEDIQLVKPLTDKVYFARGTTALLDAMCQAISGLKTKKKDKVIVFINTDGLENASTKCTREEIFNLVQQKEVLGWKFIFVGANMDSFKVGHSIGISMVANQANTGAGYKSTYQTISNMTSSYRSSGTVDASALDNIKTSIE